MAGTQGPIEQINAVTLATTNMARSVAFYTSLGFRLRYGGPGATFTSFALAEGHLNLSCSESPPSGSGVRVIFYVDDVDAIHARALDLGLQPQAPPRDAPWGERYFHIRDPDGHELSIAKRL